MVFMDNASRPGPRPTVQAFVDRRVGARGGRKSMEKTWEQNVVRRLRRAAIQRQIQRFEDAVRSDRSEAPPESVRSLLKACRDTPTRQQGAA